MTDTRSVGTMATGTPVTLMGKVERVDDDGLILAAPDGVTLFAEFAPDTTSDFGEVQIWGTLTQALSAQNTVHVAVERCIILNEEDGDAHFDVSAYEAALQVMKQAYEPGANPYPLEVVDAPVPQVTPPESVSDTGSPGDPDV